LRDAKDGDVSGIMEKPTALSHIVVSQGYPGTFGKHRMQPWVENVNEFLRGEGFAIHLFACGDNNLCFTEKQAIFNISKRLVGLSDQFSPVAVTRAFLDEKPSVAVIHGLQHLLTLFSMIVYFFRRVPVVIIVHGLYISDSILLSVRDFLMKSLLYVFRRYYSVVALTDYDRKLLEEKWWIPLDRIKITKAFLYVNKTELDKLHQIENSEIKTILERQKTPVFLYVGRLDHDQKRVDEIVKTFYRFLKLRHSNAELMIAGTGPLKSALSRIIAELGMQDQIKLVGSVTEEEKWLHYLSSRALLLMSKFEGMPRVIFEAFAAGKIVIAPDVCGLSEVIKSGVNGFLFKQDEEVPRLLEKIASNGQFLQIMEEATQKLTRMVFTSEKGQKELKLILESQM